MKKTKMDIQSYVDTKLEKKMGTRSKTIHLKENESTLVLIEEKEELRTENQRLKNKITVRTQMYPFFFSSFVST
jgi:hypothetical protein